MGSEEEDVLDLVIRGGQVVTAEQRFTLDIGVEGGKIAQMGGPMRGTREIDARGLLVLPGGIDAHVHLTGGWVDDFTSGSEAALAGGITTLGNMTFPEEGETPEQALKRDARLVREQAIADVFLHPVLDPPSPSVREEISRFVLEGTNTIKLFLVAQSFDRHAVAYIDAAQAAGEAGILTMIHCEDFPTIEHCTAALSGRGHASLDHFAESRPVVSEVIATQRAVALCELTRAPVYIVHLSSARALRVCQEARARGLPVYVETRPLYLHLTRERYLGPEGPLYVAQPPLRNPDDVAALWEGLVSGAIDTLGSDHAPWTRAQKLDASHTLTALRPGVADLETMLPMLFSEGVHKGRLPLERFVALTSTSPARLFGLYPRKGAVQIGSDADLVLWDATETRPVRAADQRTRADYSVYEGAEVTGWPTLTLRRGEVVYEKGRVVGLPGSGRLTWRGPTTPP